MTALQVVFDHIPTLIAGGALERAFVEAYSRTTSDHDLSSVQWLLRQCNRGRLWAAGSPLPGDGPFTLYRGVSDRPGRTRIERGLSWTLSRDYACVFAATGSNGAVLTATVPAANVYFYHDPAWEQHVCCDVSEYRDLRLSILEIRRGCERFEAWLSAKEKGGPILGPAIAS